MFRHLGFRYSLYLVLLAGLCVSPSVVAQQITGDITGTVTDGTGAVLPNVTVTAVSAATNGSRSGTTNDTGAFRIPGLAIGTYKVTASAEGFKSAVQTVEVLSGGLIQASFKLTIGQRTETVEVEGTAPLVELSPNNNNYVDAEKIANVPLNGRDFNSLLAITPGVQRTPGGGFLAVSINGSRTTSNNYFIDGLYNNDRYYGDSAIGETGVVGIPATVFPPEALEELSVQETPSAEFGVKGGSPINMVMKSGSNGFHGTATWVRHTAFADASNYFNKINGCGGTPDPCAATPIREFRRAARRARHGGGHRARDHRVRVPPAVRPAAAFRRPGRRTSSRWDRSDWLEYDFQRKAAAFRPHRD